MGQLLLTGKKIVNGGTFGFLGGGGTEDTRLWRWDGETIAACTLSLLLGRAALKLECRESVGSVGGEDDS